jgi:predicted RNA-binding Zn ribbon-like protein
MLNTPEPGNRLHAPAPLDIVQSFVNSVDLEDGTDAFATFADFSTWVERHLDVPVSTLKPADLDCAIDVREALRDVLEAHTGHEPPAESLDWVNALLSRAPLEMQFLPSGEPRLVAQTGGMDGVIAALAAGILAGARDGTWQRLKICRSDSCRWAFYDRSKNRSSVWCNMATCGSKSKVRAYRKRARQREKAI